MPFNFNGNTVNDVTFNGNTVNKVNYNGVTVWEKSSIEIFWVKAQSTSGAFSFAKAASSAPSISLQYSTDSGATWTSATIGTSIPISSSKKTYIKGTNNQSFGYNTSDYVYVRGTVPYSVGGNLSTLLDSTSTADEITEPYSFCAMFANDANVVNASELKLPANISSSATSAFELLFFNCSAFVSAPELPATTLSEKCYQSMFQRSGLLSSPALPATTLAPNCYTSMFRQCASLVHAPSLPASTLANNCYEMMFDSCTSLTTAPSLPATTLAKSCYAYMFQNCSLTTAPALPASTLAETCYLYMFSVCKNLTSIPRLAASPLIGGCYNYMFYNCTKIKMSATYSTTYKNAYIFGAQPSSTYANNMFRGTGGTLASTPTQQVIYTANTIIG